MKKFKLEIETENAAFENRDLEIVRILQKLVKDILSGKEVEKIFDCNGNKVGFVKYSH